MFFIINEILILKKNNFMWTGKRVTSYTGRVSEMSLHSVPRMDQPDSHFVSQTLDRPICETDQSALLPLIKINNSVLRFVQLNYLRHK